VKRSSLVRGQRVFLRRISGQVVDAAGCQVVVELDDGRIELVPENLESVKRRQ
jgi:hypothetical protein